MHITNNLINLNSKPDCDTNQMQSEFLLNNAHCKKYAAKELTAFMEK